MIFKTAFTMLSLSVLSLTAPSALAADDFGFTDSPAYGTGGSGVQGIAYLQKDEHTSDVSMTQNNYAPQDGWGNTDPYYVQAPSNTTTSRVNDANFQRVTERVPFGRVQTGIMANFSVSPASFQGAHNLGFHGGYMPSLYGMRWGYLPPTGTGEPEVDVTPGGGY